jgi:hypothetical protein
MGNMLLQLSKHQEALDAFNQAFYLLPHYDKPERANADRWKESIYRYLADWDNKAVNILEPLKPSSEELSDLDDMPIIWCSTSGIAFSNPFSSPFLIVRLYTRLLAIIALVT